VEESVTYQAIIEEGKAQGRQEGVILEARKNLRLVGTKLFGSPSAAVTATLEEIDNPEKLEGLLVRAVDVMSWEELLGLPGRPRRRRK
jgi:predicted transposase YdaD